MATQNNPTWTAPNNQKFNGLLTTLSNGDQWLDTSDWWRAAEGITQQDQSEFWRDFNRFSFINAGDGYAGDIVLSNPDGQTYGFGGQS